MDGSVITAVGMFSALGRTVETCAAMRAGIHAPLEHQYDTFPEEGQDAPNPVDGVPVLLEGHRPGHLLRMFAPAMQDLVGNAGLKRRDLETTELYLAVPGDPRFERNHDVIRAFIPSFYRLVGVEPEVSMRVFPGGKTAVFQAVAAAVEAILAGSLKTCFVGGVDSHLDPEVLDALWKEGRLRRSPEAPGIVPGECAAVVRIESASRVAERGGRVLARLETVTTASELEDALGSAIQVARDRTLDPFKWVLSDLNGESDRIEGWLKARKSLDSALSGAELWSPLSHLGDVGAATGALLLGVAATAMGGGYAPKSPALLFCTESPSETAAALLSPPPSGFGAH